MTEVLHVVKADRHDDRDLTVSNVRRVPTSAHARFDDSYIDGRVRENGIGQARIASKNDILGPPAATLC